MHEYYERRTRTGRGHRGRGLPLALLLVVACAVGLSAGLFVFLQARGESRPVSEVDGIKTVSGVRGGDLVVYDGKEWEPQFWNGINMGATLPGHAPGELAPTEEDYLRWFPMMKKMNVDVLRVYTILSPEFYEALEEFNSGREDPLWLAQGIWSPEEELIGEDGEGNDAYTPEITQEFRKEITDAVHVVHGDAYIKPRPGHASGRFRTDVSEYMLGWIVGTEWYPYAVQATDEANPGMPPFSGEYFRSTPEATPFESWCASMLDTLAQEEMEYGWQHPVALTNWLTTDPLSHPDEANEQEDLVSVDPMHVEPTDAWSAGYFASYHVYPYYPDFLRYEKKYQDYANAEGEMDPYAGYLHELRAHHKGIPLVVAEFGVPSSRGMAHKGPLGRDQGHHTEEEQGRIEAGMLKDIRDEGYDGGILFSWQDEWFKFTWNTADIDIPAGRRPMWLNRLTNEQNFGVIANDPGETNKAIHLDGKTDDWKNRASLRNRLSNLFSGDDSGVVTRSYPGFDLSVAHDEAYLYLLARKEDGAWSFPEDELDVGFGTLPGGSETADRAPGISFLAGGIQTLLRVKGGDDTRMFINSAYDYHTWLYGEKYGMIPEVPGGEDAGAGKFLPWKLALSRPVTLPKSGREIPFQDFEVGRMKPGITDPSDPDYDSLADWYARGDVLEVRIPWTMLGYTDPSTNRVWDNLYEAGGVEPTESPGLRVYPTLRPAGTGTAEVKPLPYSWRNWEEPDYHEREKKSYSIMGEAFEDKRLEPIP